MASATVTVKLEPRELQVVDAALEHYFNSLRFMGADPNTIPEGARQPRVLGYAPDKQTWGQHVEMSMRIAKRVQEELGVLS